MRELTASPSSAQRAADLDARTRHLLHAAKEDLRRYLRVPDLDQAMVAKLYLQVREVLQDWQAGADPRAREALLDELALAIYFVATAWRAESDPGPELLASLRRALGAALDPRTITKERSEP